MTFGARKDCSQAQAGKPHQQARGATFGDRRQQVGGRMSYKPRPTACCLGAWPAGQTDRQGRQASRLEDWQQAFKAIECIDRGNIRVELHEQRFQDCRAAEAAGPLELAT